MSIDERLEELEGENKELRRELKDFHRLQGMLCGGISAYLVSDGISYLLNAKKGEMFNFQFLAMLAGFYLGGRYIGNYFNNQKYKPTKVNSTVEPQNE